MLAGKIKLRTFLILAALGVTLLIGAIYKLRPEKKPEQPRARVTDRTSNEPPTKVEAPPDARPPETPALPAGSILARSYDAEVLAARTRKLSSDKVKDASKGKPYKINLYQDAGKSTVNRAKVDVDRDDKFDEKYTFDGDTITLQRAPADDEQYTETYHWAESAGAWLPEGAELPTAPPAPTEHVEAMIALEARPHDAAVLAYRGKAIGSDKLKDVSKGKPYKINVYQDAGKAGANRAKVDLDRDDKWDEKYTFDGDTVTLQISPAEDEVYTQTYHWSGDGWATAR